MKQWPDPEAKKTNPAAKVKAMESNGQAPPPPAAESAGPLVGLVQWFRPGDPKQVEQTLAELQALGVRELRTTVSWAEGLTAPGEAWYGWLLPRLAREVRLLPCFLQTPPALGVVGKVSAPPRDPKAYADFLQQMIARHGEHFEAVELWNEPTRLEAWDWRLDPEWQIFTEMIAEAAGRARQLGKRVVLGGACPTDPRWLKRLAQRGALKQVDVVGLHGFPESGETGWESWADRVAAVREALGEAGVKPELWITETGYATWRHDEWAQVRAFVAALAAPVGRVYWLGARDPDPERPAGEDFQAGERRDGFGLKEADGTPKLLYRLWAGAGLSAVREALSWSPEKTERRRETKKPHTLITGGAGFIGANLAHRLLAAGQSVLIYDNLTRPGAERNLRWLRAEHDERLQIQVGDMRDARALRQAVQNVDQVFHFAGQVAVTRSLARPEEDFAVNAQGTLNLLGALRALESPPPLLYSSSGKVYGALGQIKLRVAGTRYVPLDEAVRTNGVSEERPLEFHSPYGCSKGAADQYVLNYARTFGLPAMVFRMSCIYGLHQMGTEDQGWVTHFLLRAVEGQPITLYGDGMQVRDILFIEDLVDAFILAMANHPALSAQAFNIGGGPANTISLVEILEIIGELHSEKPLVSFAEWRPGDQRYYVSDTRKFRAATGWKPRVNVSQGIERLYQWIQDARGALVSPLADAKGVSLS